MSDGCCVLAVLDMSGLSGLRFGFLVLVYLPRERGKFNDAKQLLKSVGLSTGLPSVWPEVEQREWTNTVHSRAKSTQANRALHKGTEVVDHGVGVSVRVVSPK